MSKLNFRNLPVVSAFATTLILRDFYPEYIHRLRERLMEAFPESRFVEQDSSRTTHEPPDNLLGKGSEPRVFVVHYRGHNLLVQYAPFFVVYTFLLLYVCLSVSKIDMVKSKLGLAVSACFTVVASLGMSMSLCVAVGLMSPALRGREFFPYLVVLIGFENILVITKSVVSTPIDLPVKHRVAQGLAKEGWPITKNLFCEFVCTALGFLTFDSAIQEFCLIAMISLTTDFFLQMFFFVTVLAIDIRRMELSDLQRHVELSSARVEPEAPRHGREGVACHAGGGPVACRSVSATCSSLPQTDCHRRAKSPNPPTSQTFSGHRRVRSDVSAAAYTTLGANSGGRAVSLRERFWMYAANRRVVQDVGVAVILVWLVVFLCYAFIPTSLSGRNGGLGDGASAAHHRNRLADDRRGGVFPSPDSKDGFVDEQLYGMRSINRHGFELRWDAETLWRHVAFSAWPAIAEVYNFSLADRRLVVFEPIHVVQRVHPKQAMHLRPPAYTPSRSAEAFREGGYAESSGFSAPPSSTAEEQDFEGDRTWWSHVLAFGHKEALAALGLSWSDLLLDWTARFWSTAQMVTATLLGASFFFTLTAVGMLLVHKWLSSSKPNACREPVVRVMQMSIPLYDKELLNNDWILACGALDENCGDAALLWNTSATFNPSSLNRRRHSGESANGLVAAAFCGLGGDAVLIRSIRLWSCECGHLVSTLDRFSSDSCQRRGVCLNSQDRSRRYSAVWSMKMLPSTGHLVVGCSNATIEVGSSRFPQAYDLICTDFLLQIY
uniref:SSD domain-containing protein n=1 Tax=Mesocestoides corti TaxID=53468 RepID=A0A5K3FTH8_MESCO